MQNCILGYAKKMITKDVIKLEHYINETWPRFKTQKEIALQDLFPEPTNIGLKHIWRYGSADLTIFHNNQPICVLEPGGTQHFDERQYKNDARKFKLCELNNCRCLHMMNGLVNRLSKRKIRRLIGGFLWKKLK